MARRAKTNKQLIAEIRDHKRLCGISDQTFSHHLPMEYRKAVADYQQERFLLWWETWVEPNIAELERRLCKPAKKGKLAPFAWVDVRREAVLVQAHKVVEFYELNHNQINRLYDITVDEHENWDGEEVSVESLLTFMVARFNAVGLAPSRN
jgi:hypothetical protein